MAKSKRVAVAVITAALLMNMSTVALASGETFTDIQAGGGGGDGPSIVQQTEDGYSSITIYDGIQDVEASLYTGGLQSNITITPYTAPKFYPYSITNVSEGDYTLVVKSYEVSADVDPQELVESRVVRDGLAYTPRDILQKKLDGDTDTKESRLSVSVSVDSSDITKAIAAIKAREGESKEYDQGDGYSGSLTLDPASVIVESSGTSSYSYAITDTREYAGLERNDPSLVSKTVTKNGVTLNLVGVDFVPMGSSVSGNEIVQTYKAVASYSGTGVGSKATGYTATATYSGTVQKQVAGDYIYSIVYVPVEANMLLEEIEAIRNPVILDEDGNPIVEDETSEKKPVVVNKAILGAIGFLLLAIMGGIFVFVRSKREEDDSPYSANLSSGVFTASDVYTDETLGGDFDEESITTADEDDDDLDDDVSFSEVEGEVIEQEPEDDIKILSATGVTTDDGDDLSEEDAEIVIDLDDNHDRQEPVEDDGEDNNHQPYPSQQQGEEHDIISTEVYANSSPDTFDTSFVLGDDSDLNDLFDSQSKALEDVNDEQ